MQRPKATAVGSVGPLGSALNKLHIIVILCLHTVGLGSRSHLKVLWNCLTESTLRIKIRHAVHTTDDCNSNTTQLTAFSAHKYRFQVTLTECFLASTSTYFLLFAFFAASAAALFAKCTMCSSKQASYKLMKLIPS